MSTQLPKIFAFVAGTTTESCGYRIGPDFVPYRDQMVLHHGRAVAEDGTLLDADHPSSSAAWSQYDMGAVGTCDEKHEIYARHYPSGFTVEWVDLPVSHPIIGPMLRESRLRLPSNATWSPWGVGVTIERSALLLDDGGVILASADGTITGRTVEAQRVGPQEAGRLARVCLTVLNVDPSPDSISSLPQGAIEILQQVCDTPAIDARVRAEIGRLLAGVAP